MYNDTQFKLPLSKNPVQPTKRQRREREREIEDLKNRSNGGCDARRFDL
jgi:hypothetical protein